ncbi:hypothetical protein TREMEDRAFT_58729 [Tremella mesenterica DSM 1558]|uniref:uncharacterized protein n=1 Tax=Tremella mesenterica (strain ATCC 24925 / CBS 8224 / DSM 1558 / NBRC 9311 / NRRL Y-6157 / RJB 2259-6 / UBC 559-6) TaxID=578456 RepID=UPI0003F4A595|nr:uncharacterized protein TREMEDRAFT_58729 [Tremella mesenterica DSM 1558]EIW72558.1 hypothetical protein TREMEDRAFT_58729 [Tremella mesenterica DSM 1558]
MWVPYDTARRVCKQMGAGRLLWSVTPGEEGKGLLSLSMRDAISWEEGGPDGRLCHNWLPAKSHLPTSAYSLDALLNTPFPSISIIPDDRYMTTGMDPNRRAKLLNDAVKVDQSSIRGDQGRAWELVLKWSASAWQDFLQYPSIPPSPRLKKKIDPDLLYNLRNVHALLPLLAPDSSYTPTLDDLSHLLHSEHQSSSSDWSIWDSLPFPWPWRPTQGVRLTQRDLERRARINLGLAEVAGDILIESWKRDQEIRRLRSLFNERENIEIVFVLHEEDKQEKTPPQIQKQKLVSGENMGVVEREEELSREHELTMLEKQRGSTPSPTPRRSRIRPPTPSPVPRRRPSSKNDTRWNSIYLDRI